MAILHESLKQMRLRDENFTQDHVRDWPFDFWGGVQTILVTSEKNILHTDFEGKNSCKEIPSKKNPTLKKISFMAYNAGKNLTLLYVRKKMFHQRFEEKYSYPKPNQERKYCISGHHHHLLAFVLQQILKDTAGC